LKACTAGILINFVTDGYPQVVKDSNIDYPAGTETPLYQIAKILEAIAKIYCYGPASLIILTPREAVPPVFA